MNISGNLPPINHRKVSQTNEKPSPLNRALEKIYKPGNNPPSLSDRVTKPSIHQDPKTTDSALEIFNPGRWQRQLESFASQKFTVDLNLSEYEILGEGGFGIAYKVPANKFPQIKTSKEFVVVKTLNDEKIKKTNLDSKTERRRLFKEALKLAEIDSGYVVKVLGIDLANGYIVMEYIDGGNAAEYDVLPEKALGILLDTAEGLAAMHKKNILHRDIKPENVFLDGKYQKGVLGDFGTVQQPHRKGASNKRVGTPQMVAPELYKQHDLHTQTTDKKPYTYTKDIDIWAMGITLARLVLGDSFTELFPEDNLSQWMTSKSNEDISAFLQSKFSEKLEELDPPLDPKIKTFLKKLFEACTESNPEKRITAGEIKDRISNYFKNS